MKYLGREEHNEYDIEIFWFEKNNERFGIKEENGVKTVVDSDGKYSEELKKSGLIEQISIEIMEREKALELVFEAASISKSAYEKLSWDKKAEVIEKSGITLDYQSPNHLFVIYIK